MEYLGVNAVVVYKAGQPWVPTDPDTDEGFDSMTVLWFSTAFLTHPWKGRTVDGRPGTVMVSAHERTKGLIALSILPHYFTFPCKILDLNLHVLNCKSVQVSYPVCCPDKQSLCPRSICFDWDPLHVHLPNPRVVGWRCSSSQLKSQMLKREIIWQTD